MVDTLINDNLFVNTGMAKLTISQMQTQFNCNKKGCLNLVTSFNKQNKGKAMKNKVSKETMCQTKTNKMIMKQKRMKAKSDKL